MRYGKLWAVAGAMALATTASAAAAGDKRDKAVRDEAKAPAIAEVRIESAFERVWGVLLAAWDETRGTIVPGGSGGGGGQSAGAAVPATEDAGGGS